MLIGSFGPFIISYHIIYIFEGLHETKILIF
jgi:hypothetical protein